MPSTRSNNARWLHWLHTLLSTLMTIIFWMTFLSRNQNNRIKLTQNLIHTSWSLPLFLKLFSLLAIAVSSMDKFDIFTVYNGSSRSSRREIIPAIAVTSKMPASRWRHARRAKFHSNEKRMMIGQMKEAFLSNKWQFSH